MTVTERCKTFRYYCLMPVHARLGLTLTIRELRLAKKLDQIELAELLNVSHGYISRIESGKKGCSVDLMIQISEIFGTSLDYLILGKCHDVLDAAHLKENIQQLIEDLEHFRAKL